MRLHRRLFVLVLLWGLGAGGWGAAPLLAQEAKPFITAKDLDLQLFLKPPPAVNSPEMNAELGQILTIQVTRTPDMEAAARADAVEDVWRFADVMGPKFVKESLPRTAAFFARVAETEGAVVDPAKDIWARLRPHLYSNLVKPAVRMSTSGSYPSGHATVGTLMGIVLSNMVPEKRAEIMARAWDYGWHRVIGGIHFPSDVEAGRMAGTLIAASIMARPDFSQEFAEAKAELRQGLGL